MDFKLKKFDKLFLKIIFRLKKFVFHSFLNHTHKFVKKQKLCKENIK